jgi:uncharacterized protein Gcw-chp
MRTGARAAYGVALVTAAWAAPAGAQVTVAANAAFLSGYVWRGLTFSSKPVIQPDVSLTAHGFTVGAWANIEPSKYDGSNDISQGGGIGSGVREFDAWVEYTRTTGNVWWQLGWIIYVFDMNDPPPAPPPNRFGLFPAFNTHEFYGEASLSGLPVTPTLYASYDADKVNGLYVQPSVTYGWKAAPKVTINLTGLAGFSAGQGRSPGDSANFAENGLTHVDLAASTSLAAGPVSVVPAFHFQISSDEFVRIRNGREFDQFWATGTKGSSTKVWGGVTLSWSRALKSAK